MCYIVQSTYLITRCYPSDQTNDWRSGTGSKDEWTEAEHAVFWCKNLRERDHLEEVKIILKCIFKEWDGSMD
jgi:hypothetical protein